MVGTFGAGAEHSDRREGRATLRVGEPTVEATIHRALTGLLAAALPGWSPAVASGRSAPIRAEAASLVGVVADLYGAAVDRIEGLGVAVAGIEIDGLVRSDVGLVAWGRLLIAEGPPARMRRVEIASAEEAGDGGLWLTLAYDAAGATA